MDELIEELTLIENYANEVVQKNESSNYVSILERLEEETESVSKSWCGSWLGYQSRVYYEDLKPIPPGARFDKLWGVQDRYSNDTSGTWAEYTFDGVCQAIKSVVSVSDFDSVNNAANSSDSEFNELRERLLIVLESIIAEIDDRYLARLIDELKNLNPIDSTQFIEYLRPKGQFISNDMNAIQGGIQTPPHIAVLAQIKSLQSSFDAIKDFIKLTSRAERYLKNKKKVDKHYTSGTNIFIGHGRSAAWRDLKDFFQDRLNLPWDEFNRVPVAGVTNIARLSEMLNEAAIAFLVMTAEDEQLDGKMHARMNVIHEAGLFQGRLGFSRAIVILEEGCEEFSNIQGLGQIRFPAGNIKACFEEIRQVLEREGVLEN